MLNRPSADAAPHLPDGPAFTLRDVAAPALSALDLSATRGDGVFETIGVGHGSPQALEHHLRRFARSATLLDLPAPDAAAWREAIIAAIAAIDPVAEAAGWRETPVQPGGPSPVHPPTCLRCASMESP